MGYPGGGAEKYRGIESGADFKGDLDEPPRLGAVRRLQHGQLCELRVIAVVLLVLGTVQGWIIGGYDDQRSVGPRVANREQGIGGHIHSDVFHGDQSLRPGHGRPDSHLQGYLFIGGPFGVHTFVF